MNSMDKILRIANGAKPMNTTMSSADRIMQYAAPQAEPQPQDNSAWGRFKNFAGSNAGRTLLGGLGAGLGVALTGGNFQDALGYGVIGAGNTVGVLNQNKRYANQLKLKQQERADALAKEQRDNQFRLTLQDKALEKSKQLADYQLDKTLTRLRGEQEIKTESEEAERRRKINAINSNPFLTDDQKQWQIAELNSGSTFDRGAYYTDTLSRDPNNQEALDYFSNRAIINNLINSANYTETVLKNADKYTPESFGNFSRSGDISQLVPNKKYASGDLGLVQMMVGEGTPFAEALDRVGKMTPGQKVAFEGEKAGAIKAGEFPYTIASQNNQARNNLGNDMVMAGINFSYDQQAADNDLWRSKQLEAFKNSLPLPEQRLIKAQAEAMGVPEDAIYWVGFNKQMADAQQVWANVAKTRIEAKGRTPQTINAEYIKNNPEMADSPVFKSGGTTVNIGGGSGYAGAYGKKRVENIAANMDEIVRNSQDKINTFSRALQLLDKINTGAKYAFPGASGLYSLTNSDAAEFNALANEVIPQMRPAGSGAASDRDMEIFRKATFALDKPKETNRNLLSARIAAEKNEIARQELMGRWIEQGRSPAAFDFIWRSYLNANPIFSDENGNLNKDRMDAYSYFDSRAPAGVPIGNPVQEKEMATDEDAWGDI